MSDGSTLVAVLRLLVSLGAVLTLVVWIARYAAKRGVGGARTTGGDVTVEVLSRRPLGRTSSVQVVRVGARTLMLGVTEHGISVLGELDAKELEEEEPVGADAVVVDHAAGRSGRHRHERPPVPQGWPWSAGSFVLKQLQAGRG